MGLKTEYRQALEELRSRLCSEFKVRHMLPDLIGIITYDESDDLNQMQQNRTLNSEFIRILMTRTDQDFEKFNQLLIESDSTAVRELGKDLQEAVRNGKSNNCIGYKN